MELLTESIVPEHAHEVKQEAREFAEEHIEPNAAEYYEKAEYPWEVLEAGMDAGLVAQDIDEEYGGRGFSIHEILAITEEFHRADSGIALTLQLASFGAEIIDEHGPRSRRKGSCVRLPRTTKSRDSPSPNQRRGQTSPEWRQPPKSRETSGC